MSLADGNILDKIAMVVPVKNVAKPNPLDRKRSIHGSNRKLISPRLKPSEKRRSVLGDPKHGPGSEPHWKAGSACYPDFYKALLDEPSRTKRIKMVRDCANSLSMRNQYYQDGSLDIVATCEYIYW